MTQKIVVTGASGLLGQVLSPHLAGQGHEVYGLCNAHPILKKSPNLHEVICDLTSTKMDDVLNNIACDTLIHTAGLTSVDQCEIDPVRAFLLNTEIPVRLAEWCMREKVRYVFISSDHVTEGKIALFSEEDQIFPVNVYAQTKAQAEREIQSIYPESLILRTNFFGRGPAWRKSLTDWLWDKAVASERIPAFTDSYFSPISSFYLARAIADLGATSERGIFHVSGSERLSKYDFALKFMDFFGFDRSIVVASRTSDAHLSAPRPPDMSMSVKKIEKVLKRPMPTVMESFESIKADYRVHG